MKLFSTVVFALALILFFYWSKIYVNDVNLASDKNQKISINIPFWTPVKKVWKILKEKDIIKNEFNFLLYLKLNKLELKLQAWDFIFNTPISITDLVDQLQNAKQEDVRITIPEWSTIDDIDSILTNKWLIDDWEFIKCAKECKFNEYNFFYDWNIEWYLFPDTYFVPIMNFTVEKFIKRLLSNFQIKVLSEEFKLEYKKQNKSLSDIIIMASIIEREERNTKNMSTVSWILWKRIREWITLWADATTRYFKKSKQWFLSTKDFQQDNPYNTRKYRWLTPTAISNPWLAAIRASLYPKETDYYFYLHDSSGQIHYAKTNDDHNFNKFKYIK